MWSCVAALAGAAVLAQLGGCDNRIDCHDIELGENRSALPKVTEKECDSGDEHITRTVVRGECSVSPRTPQVILLPGETLEQSRSDVNWITVDTHGTLECGSFAWDREWNKAVSHFHYCDVHLDADGMVDCVVDEDDTYD